MHIIKRFLRFSRGLSKLTIAFMPMFIVLFIFMAIFQLKADIHRDIKDVKRVYKKDREIVKDKLKEVSVAWEFSGTVTSAFARSGFFSEVLRILKLAASLGV